MPEILQRLWSHPTCWRYTNKTIITIIMTLFFRTRCSNWWEDLSNGYCQTSVSLQVDAAARRPAVSHPSKHGVIYAFNMKMSTSNRSRFHQTTRSGGLCCLGEPPQKAAEVSSVYSTVQEKLKSAIITAWQQLSQVFLERSIGEWRRRLENVIGYSVMADSSNMPQILPIDRLSVRATNLYMYVCMYQRTWTWTRSAFAQ